jgi:signal transduction histidine kinase
MYGLLTQDQREVLQIVERSTDRMIKIVNDLLDIARIEAGRIELVMQPLDLSSLLEKVALELQPEWQGKTQQLRLDFQPGLPFALCDETRTAQIAGNLLSNAIKYTPPQGQITMSLALMAEDGFLRVSVADSGIGISTEDQLNIFKRFFRAGNVGSTGVVGTGLGLYISRSLVELLGGQIWFESVLNKGSTFHVSFPIAGRPVKI